MALVRLARFRIVPRQRPLRGDYRRSDAIYVQAPQDPRSGETSHVLASAFVQLCGRVPYRLRESSCGRHVDTASEPGKAPLMQRT